MRVHTKRTAGVLAAVGVVAIAWPGPRLVVFQPFSVADFLADFGFVARRWEGDVCLARLELGGPDKTATARELATQAAEIAKQMGAAGTLERVADDRGRYAEAALGADPRGEDGRLDRPACVHCGSSRAAVLDLPAQGRAQRVVRRRRQRAVARADLAAAARDAAREGEDHARHAPDRRDGARRGAERLAGGPAQDQEVPARHALAHAAPVVHHELAVHDRNAPQAPRPEGPGAGSAASLRERHTGSRR